MLVGSAKLGQEIAETLKGLPADQLAKIKESQRCEVCRGLVGFPTLENERLEPKRYLFNSHPIYSKRENHFPKDPDPFRDFS